MNKLPVITFQPLKQSDFVLLHRWLNEPHIKEWWDKSGYTLTQIEEKYSPRLAKDSVVSCFIIEVNSQPIGYIQAYWLRDFPQYTSQLSIDFDYSTAGVDVFIGESNALYRGLGSAAIKQFIEDFIFKNWKASQCMVAPHENNTAAIKAYNKAGFKHLETVKIEDGSIKYVMVQHLKQL